MPAETNHPVFAQPSDPSVPVWRFMDVAKFAHLLLTSSLFFVRADLLGDPFEGTLPRGTREQMEGWLRQVYASGGHTPERIEQIIHGGPDFPGPGMLEDIKQMYKLQREWVYISCWHANPHESAAMWRLYTQTQDAVAIRSTYERLARCLSNDALIGLVHYVDFEQMTIALTNAFLPLVFKRKSFEHEREVRAVIAEYPKENGRLVYRPNTKPGRPIHVDLAALIEAVYVAPLARDWFLELVQLMCGNAGLAVDVRRSSLDSKAVW